MKIKRRLTCFHLFEVDDDDHGLWLRMRLMRVEWFPWWWWCRLFFESWKGLSLTGEWSWSDVRCDRLFIICSSTLLTLKSKLVSTLPTVYCTTQYNTVTVYLSTVSIYLGERLGERFKPSQLCLNSNITKQKPSNSEILNQCWSGLYVLTLLYVL